MPLTVEELVRRAKLGKRREMAAERKKLEQRLARLQSQRKDKPH
jgi:hypothetical protein